MLAFIAPLLSAGLGAQPMPAPQTSVAGSVADTSGRRLAGVNVRLDGPQTASTQTLADGSFAFSRIRPGIYRLTVRKPSFDALARSDIVVSDDAAVRLDLTLAPVSFTSLRQIGSTSANRPGTVAISTSPAAISTVSSTTLADQDVHQVSAVLNEVPGIITTVPANSTNIAAGILSTTQIPQIRGALPYETESLIDGHPISVGYSGSFAPLFINPNQLDSVEIVKGPGAAAPDINYAVGGSVNYITLSPTARPHYGFAVDVDSYGGVSSSFKATGTTDRGKLGYAFAYSIDGTPGPLNSYRAPGAVTEIANGSHATINGTPYCGTYAAGTSCFQGNLPGPANVVGLPNFTLGLYACCAALQSQYLARAELAKIRYEFSQQTSFTAAFLGGQSSAAYAQTFSYPGLIFAPPSGYSGSVPAGISIPLAFNTYAPYTLATTQGLFESELRTSLGNNSLLFRYYTGANDSNDYNVPFAQPYAVSTTVWGGLPNAAGGTTFYNGTPAQISVTGAGTAQPTLDHYDGISGELDVPQGNNLYSLSFDRTRHSSYYAELFDLSSQDTTIIPSGSSQAFTTFSARGQFALGPAVNVSLANYFIDYRTHYTADGGQTWGDANNAFYAPRLALTDRLGVNSVLRFSAGSSIAPPYLALVTTQGGAPQPNVEGDPSYYTVVRNTGQIKPESAFGYDLGFDRRLERDTAVSGDVYLTQLHGQYLTSTSADGTYTGTSGVNEGFTAPLFVQQTQNLGTSRYEGVELSVHRSPLHGVGFRAQGSLMRAYVYGLPAGFYDTANGPNTTNLGVIANINYQPNGLTFNGLSNGRIPYATGYAELNYRAKRAYFLLGATYYGNNNAFNEPAFAVLNGSVRYDLARNTQLQLTANNISSAYSTTFGSLQGGVPVPLVGGLLGAVPGVTVGPSNFRLVLRHDFAQ